MVANRNTTRHFVVAGRQRSVPGHAMESLTQVRYGMWFLSQFPYVDRTTYIPSLNLTSETQACTTVDEPSINNRIRTR